MIFGIGECKAAEEKISKLMSTGIAQIESYNINHKLTVDACREIAEQQGLSVTYLKRNATGLLFQWYTFDSPPFIYELIQLTDGLDWSLNITGTKEFNRIVITYDSRKTSFQEKLDQL